MLLLRWGLLKPYFLNAYPVLGKLPICAMCLLAFMLRLLALLLPRSYSSDCSDLAVRTGVVWCGLVPGRVESWVRALGFPPFSLSPDPPDLLDARHERVTTYKKIRYMMSYTKVSGSERRNFRELRAAGRKAWDIGIYDLCVSRI